MCALGTIYKQARPTRKNPLLWRIRSVAELGRRGNQAVFAHPLVYPPCLKQSGQRPTCCWERTSGARLGGWPAPTHVFVWLRENVKAVCVPAARTPLFSVFVWIIRRGILVLSNNSLRFIKGFVWLILKQSAADRSELSLCGGSTPRTPYPFASALGRLSSSFLVVLTVQGSTRR